MLSLDSSRFGTFMRKCLIQSLGYQPRVLNKNHWWSMTCPWLEAITIIWPMVAEDMSHKPNLVCILSIYHTMAGPMAPCEQQYPKCTWYFGLNINPKDEHFVFSYSNEMVCSLYQNYSCFSWIFSYIIQNENVKRTTTTPATTTPATTTANQKKET